MKYMKRLLNILNLFLEVIKMGFFNKTDEEKRLEEEKRLKREEENIKKAEKMILDDGVFYGKVGHIHQGLSYAGV